VTVDQDAPAWGGWKFPQGDAEPPLAAQRAVHFQSKDGTALQGEFWAQDHPAPTIIISHGFHLPSRHFRPVAALEYATGANVLLFDYRGHGESAHVPTTCGNAEINDLHAAIELAVGMPETLPNRIYIHGFSMGAAVALLLPHHPAVAGIIADSAYARLDDMIRMIIGQIFRQETAGWRGPTRAVRALIPVLTRLTFTSGRMQFRARYRKPLIARPERAFGEHARRRKDIATEHAPPPILLIHAERDPLIAVHHAHRLVAAAEGARQPIQVYYTPCAIHCGSYGHDPEQYIQILRDFLRESPPDTAAAS
jgi:uncharacterized protein